MKKYCRPFILVLACLAASDAPAQNPTPTQPPAYVDEAPLPKGWPKPGPYDQVSEKSYPPYRAAFTTAKRENGAFGTLFSHIQKNDIPMTAPVEISMAEGDGQNLRQTSLAFLYQDTAVGKTGADGANVEVRDVPATETLSYTWQGDRNEANIAKAKAGLEAALKDRKIEAKGFRLLGYNGPGIPELKRTWELQALLRASALATSATLPATSTTLGSAAAPQAPKVDVEKQKLQPAVGEKFDPSEIRQALSELQALQKGGGSNPQIQEKKAALKAAIESGIKKDRKSVLRLLFNIEPKAAFAWANQQTDTKLKDLILGGIIASVEGKNPNGAVAYIQLLWPGASEERTIPEAFRMAAYDDFQGALAVMQSLPKGRTKDLATKGISQGMDYKDPQAAMDMASGIGDTGIRTAAELVVVVGLARKDPDAAIQWMLSLPEGQTKDLALKSISQGMYNNPQAAWYLASVIGDEDIRNQAKRYVVWYWFLRDRPAASQWMQSLPVGQAKDFALNYISYQLTMSERQAALNMASEIGDTGIRTEAMVFAALSWCDHDRAAATQWMQSLPVGPNKDLVAKGIVRALAANDPQAAFDIAAGIGNSDLRTTTLKNVVEQWSKKDPAAATQWINRSTLPQDLKTQLLQR